MRRASTSFCFIAATIATTATADEALETALGGPVLECSGALVWAPETSGGKMDPMSLQIAVADSPASDKLALVHR